MLAILLRASSILALNPSLDLNQYSHVAWTLREGALKGFPRSLTQTADGYLWLATEAGALRFDGVRFVSWRPPTSTALSSDTAIVKLLGTRDGSLWIGTSLGLARLKDGELLALPDLEGRYIGALLEDREGTVWAGTSGGFISGGTLCAIRDLTVRCVGEDGSLGRFVFALHEDGKGNLWVGAASGLYRWRPSPARLYPLPSALSEIHAVAEDARGVMVLSLNRELRQIRNGRLERFAPDGVGGQIRPTAILRDRHGSLWIGTQDQGLLHLHHGQLDRFGRSDGLSGNFVQAVFEDREDNVWVATLGGLDRFRDFPVATISQKQGLSDDAVISVAAAGDGGVWIGTSKGVNQWKDGRVTVPRALGTRANDGAAALFSDAHHRTFAASSHGVFQFQGGQWTRLPVTTSGYVQAITDDPSANLWISDQERGLLRLRDNQIVETIPWKRLGGRPARALSADPHGDGLWLGFFGGGIAHYSGGQVRRLYGVADGLGHGDVAALRVDDDGTVWAATQGGLSRISRDRVLTLTSRNGLPCEASHSVIEDDSHTLWLYTVCGLVRIGRAALEEWLKHPDHPVGVTTFDSSDGVQGHAELGSFSPKMTKSPDGRLWFATYDGAGMIDPLHLSLNAKPPPVHIEQVVADRTVYEPGSHLRLPARVRDFWVDYTALSLVDPAKVRFRYLLEGHDRSWVDAGSRRQAFYTNLPPHLYRFRVMASNNDGVWNESGASLDFSVIPAFYETTAFRIVTVILAILCAWAAYLLRLRAVGDQMNLRFAERIAERTRIAQELHDTLLQGSLSASMQLQVVADQVTDDQLQGKLRHVVQRLGHVVEEGRNAVQGLRSSAHPEAELGQMLARAAEDLRGHQDIDVRLHVEGAQRPLRPTIQVNIYRIALEALANAFRHARATCIEVELDYAHDQLRLLVRDDGGGLPPTIAQAGLPGHFGILGMRERAERVGGTLRLWSGVKAGTEVELRIPATIAYQSSVVRRWRFGLWRVRPPFPGSGADHSDE